MTFIPTLIPSKPTLATKNVGTLLSAETQSWTWPLLLIAIGSSISLFYTCTVPLVGFAAVAATTTSRNRAIFVCSLVWLANQICGYALHGYPCTFNSFAWGIVMGVGVLSATALASVGTARLSALRSTHFLGNSTLFLVLSFAVYEVIIGLASLSLGGLEFFTPKMLWDIFITNAVWTLGLIFVHAVLTKSSKQAL